MLDAALKRRLIGWEVICVCWLILIGGLMHALYELTGYWKPVALIAPVNESIWEHMKMFFWPGLLFAIVQYLIMRQRIANFWLAKLVALTLTPVLSAITFVAYTAIAEAMGGRATVGITGSLSMICVAVGQAMCCRVMISETKSVSASLGIPLGYLLLILSFSSFSYFPPKYYLFEHHDNYMPAGQYGLDADHEQSGRTD